MGRRELPHARRTRESRRKADLNPWSPHIDDACETVLGAWCACAFRPERPTRSQGGTDGSNPSCSGAASAVRRDDGPTRPACAAEGYPGGRGYLIADRGALTGALTARRSL
jgi:hypothetical protein